MKVTLKAPNASESDLQRLHDEVMKTSPVGSILERPIPVQATLEVAR